LQGILHAALVRICSAQVAVQVRLVHSAGPQGPDEGSGPFAARLREELGPGYEVLFPIMPDPDDPHDEAWSDRLEQLFAEVDDPIVVVGHSLGGSTALKHLSRTAHLKSIAGLVLVATPFWGESEWEAEFALPEGWPTPDTELPPIFLFHSRDDEEIPFANLERYAARLPDATVRPLDGCGHLFDRGDLSEIGEAIREMGPG
jgi:predicted alpha/beta hydrolase family esterase